jgi:hypothetical protein
MIKNGCFVITDISGYTQYLSSSELDHAHEILQSLFDAQISQLKPPFVISNFQGDAILSYIPEDNILHKQTIIELIEDVYYSFMKKRELIRINTTCTCNACKNIDHLDLKIFVHYGQYMIQEMLGRQELIGPDVILVHRMMKNRVREEADIEAYALFTKPAAAHLELLRMCPEAVEYEEHFDQIGKVEMLVYSLRSHWLKEKEKRRICVTREQAWMMSEFEVEVPQAFVWEFMTNAHFKKQWAGFLSIERTDTLEGRVREGSSFHCAHREMDFHYTLLDWKPFEYYTCQETGLNGLIYERSYVLKPTEKGTSFACYVKYPIAGPVEETREMMKGVMDAILTNLKDMVQDAYHQEKISDSD